MQGRIVTKVLKGDKASQRVNCLVVFNTAGWRPFDINEGLFGLLYFVARKIFTTAGWNANA